MTRLAPWQKYLSAACFFASVGLMIADAGEPWTRALGMLAIFLNGYFAFRKEPAQ